MKRDQLLQGNSALEGSRSAAQIGGPALGGALVSLLSAPIAAASLARRKAPPVWGETKPAYGFWPATKYALIVSVRTPAGASLANVSRSSASKPAQACPQKSRDEYDVEQR